MKTVQNPIVRACAKPIGFFHDERPESMVVGLHGFTGYPGELALPAKRVFEAGFDVMVPRYPGHGTNGRDFMKTGADDWIGEALRVVDSVREPYKKIQLIGHSMGGAIAVVVASRRPIGNIVLYAPALTHPTLPSNTIKILSKFVSRKRKEWAPDPSYPFFDERDQDDDVFLGSEYWSWNYPKQVHQLDLIRIEAARVLSSLSNDILVFTGGKDAVIPQEAGTMVVKEGKGNNQWVHLPKGTHLIPYDKDEDSREEAMERTVGWFGHPHDQ